MAGASHASFAAITHAQLRPHTLHFPVHVCSAQSQSGHCAFHIKRFNSFTLLLRTPTAEPPTCTVATRGGAGAGAGDLGARRQGAGRDLRPPPERQSPHTWRGQKWSLHSWDTPRARATACPILVWAGRHASGLIVRTDKTGAPAHNTVAHRCNYAAISFSLGGGGGGAFCVPAPAHHTLRYRY